MHSLANIQSGILQKMDMAQANRVMQQFFTNQIRSRKVGSSEPKANG